MGHMVYVLGWLVGERDTKDKNQGMGGRSSCV